MDGILMLTPNFNSFFQSKKYFKGIFVNILEQFHPKKPF